MSPFDDPIGKDAVIQWPGGVNMQLYWHTTPPSYPALQTIPENRVYVSADRAPAFVRSFLAFSHGKVVSDNPHAPGVEIGRTSDTYRRIRISSVFGAMAVLVTDGHLPYPYGREMTGYEVANLAGTLEKAKLAGASFWTGRSPPTGGTLRWCSFRADTLPRSTPPPPRSRAYASRLRLASPDFGDSGPDGTSSHLYSVARRRELELSKGLIVAAGPLGSREVHFLAAGRLVPQHRRRGTRGLGALRQ